MLKTLIYLCILVHWGWYGIAAMGAVVFFDCCYVGLIEIRLFRRPNGV